MILPAHRIRELCTTAYPMIEPFYERTEFQYRQYKLSYGLGPAGYDVRLAERQLIMPQGFHLGSTLEEFRIPTYIMGIVHDKSTLARRGLTVQNTVIEPGWRGFLTLEITNHSTYIVELEEGTPIAQIVFHELSDSTKQPYEGKYQDQERGPQGAR